MGLVSPGAGLHYRVAWLLIVNRSSSTPHPVVWALRGSVKVVGMGRGEGGGRWGRGEDRRPQ